MSNNKGKLLSVRDIGEILNRSDEHVRKLINRENNPLPGFNEGRRTPWYCYQADLDEWLEGIKAKSMEARKK